MGYLRYKVDNNMDEETEKNFDRMSNTNKDAVEKELGGYNTLLRH